MAQFRILSRIREQPIFGGRRILWIIRADQSTGIDPSEILEKNAKSLTTVVLEGPEKLLSSWSKSIPVYSLTPPSKPADREAWIHFLARQYGLSLDKNAIGPLLSTFEGALGPVDRLFKDLAQNGMSGKVKAEDLERHGVSDHYKTVFDLIRGLENGDRKFFREWERFLEGGQSPFGLISLLHRQWRLYRIARQALSERKGTAEAERAVSTQGGVPAFVAGNVVRFAGRITLETLRKGTGALWEADLLLKSGVSSTLVMDQLAATLFSLSRKKGNESSQERDTGFRRATPKA